MCNQQPPPPHQSQPVPSQMSMSSNGSIPAASAATVYNSSDQNPNNSSNLQQHHHHHHHHLLLDDFGDDFDVSLSGLCLSNTESPLIRDINQVFTSLGGDIVKVEEDYSHGLPSSAAHGQSHAKPPGLSPSSKDFPDKKSGSTPGLHHSNSHDSALHQSAATTTSPIHSNNLNSQTHPHPHLHPHQLSHLHHHPHHPSSNNGSHPGSDPHPQSIQSPSPVASSQSQHQQSLGCASSSSTDLLEALSQRSVASLFECNLDQSFYSPMQSNSSQLEDDSCQSNYTSSDTGSTIHRSVKPIQLATVLENVNYIAQNEEDDHPNSKRICFKGIVDKESHHPHHQSPSQLVHTSQISLSPLAANIEPRVSPELSESIYSTLNVANSYGYAWRRWSKTDAPVVKNKAGSVQVPHTMAKIAEDKKRQFQYVLGAPTAAGTKIGVPTMTYLNQGQSYEIRVKKLKKNPSDVNLQSCVRLGFVEKRLQYREDEEMDNWSLIHSKDRLLDIDFTMSYGVFEIDLAATKQNVISFVWNPGREASIFIKVNCISTEFTSKRHGGERGAPLRLVVDTYSIGDSQKLDAASCLIKVFKSKGAERKHKTDRDRMAKHPDAELYYQPSYDCTLLTKYKEEPLIPPSATSAEASGCETTSGQSVLLSPGSGGGGYSSSAESSAGLTGQQLDSYNHSSKQSQSGPTVSSPELSSDHSVQSTRPPTASSPTGVKCEPLSAISSPISTTDLTPLFSGPASSQSPTRQPTSSQHSGPQLPQSTSVSTSDASAESGGPGANSALFVVDQQQHGGEEEDSLSPQKVPSGTLSHNADAQQTYQWLKKNRFSNLADQLSDYTADDLRRLSRDDLIQLCDVKDGIRLFNLIHTPQSAITKLTIFITLDGSEHFALFFKSLTIEEFREKLHESFSDCLMPIRNMHLIGPSGIRVKLTNNVIQNMKNESIYYCILNKVDDEFDVVLRLTSAQ